MTEQKDDSNEQQTFLSDHEDLLKSIHKKAKIPDEQPEAVEPVEETPEVVEEKEEEEEEVPVVESPMIEEPTPEPAPEPEPPVKTPVAETLPATRKPASTTGPNKLGGKKKKKKTPVHPQHSPQHEEQLKKQVLEQQEVKEVLTFFSKYAKPAVIGVVAISVIFLTNALFRNNRLKKEAAADTALMQAGSVEELQIIVDKYASTPSEPFALMRLALEKFQDGQIEEAEGLYKRFIEKHGNHELAAQAKLNLITCKESKGQLNEAQALYGTFAKEHETSFLAPSAMMSQARCLEALNQPEEARIVYEDIGAKYPNPTWARPAASKLKVLLGKME